MDVGSKSVVVSLSLRILLVLAMFAILDSAYATGRQPAEIQSIQVVQGSETDFVVSASQRFQFYMYALNNPDRLVIDCRPAQLADSISGTLKETHPVVKGVRAEPSQGNVVLIVFDLKQKAKYSALMTGSDLRIRIAAPAIDQRIATRKPADRATSEPAVAQVKPEEVSPPPPASASTVATPPAGSNSVELSVSTEGKQQIPQVDENKDAKKQKMKMKGYVVDHFQRNVVGSKGREASTGSSYGMSVRYRKKDKDNRGKLKVDYTISGNEYAEPFADDYMSQDFKLGYELKLGSNWTLKNVGSLGLYEYGSEYGFRPELAYQINERSSFSVFAGHRTKLIYSYHDRTDQNRFVGTRFRYRFGRQTLELGYQRNFNDSERDRYDYVRSKYSIGYNVPWTKTAKTTFKLEYSPREYQSRFIAWVTEQDLESGTLRYDQGWTFTLTSRIALSRHLDLVPKYVFQDRTSNDPGIEDFSLHVSSIALRGRW